jgi:hypothetical protein
MTATCWAGCAAAGRAICAATADIAVAKVSVPAAAMMITRERLVDGNAGGAMCRAKGKPLPS